MLLYEQIAQKIETQIERQILKAGERVPSIREISQSEGISATTAVQAYMHLEQKGILESRPRSGFFVSHLPERLPEEIEQQARLPKVVPVKINDLIYEMFQVWQNSSIIPLGTSSACYDENDH